jgi:hypothetical protein
VQAEEKRGSTGVSQACGVMSLSCSASDATNSSDYSSPLIKMTGRVNGRPASLMIDSGSSSNFISCAFVRRHRLPSVRLETKQTVQLADGSEYVVKRGVKGVSV